MAIFEPSPLAPRRTAEEQARDRDLGFGSVVSRSDGTRRLLNRDGSFNVSRTGLGVLESFAPYHLLLTISWPGFLGLVALLYVVINLVFALAYLACGHDALVGGGATLGGAFWRAFFFSIETFATIGYGQIAPNGIAPNLLVTFEALVGLMYQALATGLLFARFAKPTASILFSGNAVVAPYANSKGLMFRIVNRRRRNEIIELEAQVLYSAVDADGIRRYTALTLERNKVTFFPLSWTIVHPIDESSPLAGKSPADLERTAAEILVLLSGIDETFEQTVHARSSYRADEIVWNARFQSIFAVADPTVATGVTVDVSRVHDIERLGER